MATVIGTLELKATIENIGVISRFSGDPGGNNRADIAYRRVGTTTWKSGVIAEPQPCPQCGSPRVAPVDTHTWRCPVCDVTWSARTMTPDRRATVNTDNGVEANPYVNQWRAIIFWLQPNTTYEVRVTYSDPQGVAGENPTIRTIKTRNDNPPSNGNVYHVATTGSDSNSGSLSNPWRTPQHAADTGLVAGARVKLHPGTYGPVTMTGRHGSPDNYITFESYDPHNRAVINGGNRNFELNQCSSIRISKLNLTKPNGANVGIEGGSYFIVEDCILHECGGGYWDAGVAAYQGTKGVLSQRNQVSRYRIAEECHAFFFYETLGEHVIKGNSTTGVDGCFRDNVGGDMNGLISGGVQNTSFIYDNYFEGNADDGIEIEGGDVNCAVWDNICVSLGSMKMGLGIAPVIIGPLYAFRNILVGFYEGGFKCGGYAFGHVYAFHNTLISQVNGAGVTDFGHVPDYNNHHFMNNIFYVQRFIIAAGGELGNSYDYNCGVIVPGMSFNGWWAGRHLMSLADWRTHTGQSAHSISANPIFVNVTGLDFRLQAGSPCINTGALLYGFNGPDSPWPYRGAAPDMGAIEAETGTVPPQAVFSADPMSGPAPLTVNFTDLSTGSINQWLWQFGDGVVSSVPNPTHTYENDGQYTVRLTVTGPEGSSYIEKTILVSSAPTYTLAISVSEGGSTSPLPGDHEYPENTNVQLSALPFSDYQFVEWRENGIFLSSDTIISVVMSQDRHIMAMFELSVPPPPFYTVTISLIGQGDTNPDPGPHDYEENTFVDVEAFAAPSWKFDHWEGDVGGTSPVVQFTVISNMSVVAVFKEKEGVSLAVPIAATATLGMIIAIASKRRVR